MRLCEVSRRRFRCQDVVRILILPRYFPQICSCKESAWGRGPMSGEVGGKGGIRTVNPDHPRRKPPQVADEEGWKHKRRLSRGEISLLLAPPSPPPPTHPPPPLTSDHPLLTPQGANSEEASGVARKFKVSRTSKFFNLSTSKASIANPLKTLDQI